MHTLTSFVSQHTTTDALVAMWFFSNIVTALPSPAATSGGFYKFFFAFAHGLSGSLPRVFPATRVFNDPTQGSKTYFANGQQPPVPPAGG